MRRAGITSNFYACYKLKIIYSNHTYHYWSLWRVLQWSKQCSCFILPDTIDLRIITCKSKLLTEAERRKPPTSCEADAVSDGIDLAEPYLMQSTAKANYIFSDMASIQFVSRNKAFSNFLLELSMKISKFPNLNAVAVLFLANLFSRQCDYVTFERKSTNLSQ